MTEQENQLIREFVYLTLLIEEAKQKLSALPSSSVSLPMLHMATVKHVGRFLRSQLQMVHSVLKAMRIYVSVEDQGDMYYVHTTREGHKERFGVKRRVMRETLDEYVAEMLVKEFEKIPVNDTPYKPVMPTP